MAELILDYGKYLITDEKYGLERRLNEVIHQGKFSVGKPETIEELWNIYYKYPMIEYETKPENRSLFKIHQYILDKGINPIKYVKDEFDYIRSFLSQEKFEEYLDIERRNRFIRI
jgi:hypothetical protein